MKPGSDFFCNCLLKLLSCINSLVLIENDCTSVKQTILKYIFLLVPHSLTAFGKDLDNLLCQGNTKRSNVYDWLCASKLTLSQGKTICMIFPVKTKVKLFPSKGE